MGKSEVGSPKWIAKQMKMKGLQKLKWYCQACEKQCRDDHGFRLHLQSPSHLARSETAEKNKQRLSVEFEMAFLAILKTQHGKPVGVNRIYSEMIQDKQHIHMNATRFKSLTGFTNYLASKQLVLIKAREPELIVQYLDLEAQQREECKVEAQHQKRAELERLNKALLTSVLESETNEAESDSIHSEAKLSTEAEYSKARPKIGFSLKKKK